MMEDDGGNKDDGGMKRKLHPKGDGETLTGGGDFGDFFNVDVGLEIGKFGDKGGGEERLKFGFSGGDSSC